jgi:periplasmic protein TonB
MPTTNELQTESGRVEASANDSRSGEPNSHFQLLEPPGVMESLVSHLVAWLRDPGMKRGSKYYRGEVDLPLSSLRPWYVELPAQIKLQLEKPTDPVGAFNWGQSFKRAVCGLLFAIAGGVIGELARGGIAGPLFGAIGLGLLGWFIAALLFKKREYAADMLEPGSQRIFVESPGMAQSLLRQIREMLSEPKVTVPAQYYRGEVTLPATDMRLWLFDLPGEIRFFFQKPPDEIGIFNRTQEFKRAAVTAGFALAGAVAGWAARTGAWRVVLFAIAGTALGRVVSIFLFKKREYPPDIMQDYAHQTVSWVNSLVVHLLVIGAMVLPFIISRMGQQTVKASTKLDFTDISPYLPQLPPAAKQAGGGGGGGDRSPTPPSKGAVPKFAWTQFTPPMAKLPNPDPKLPMQPTLLGPPDLKLPQMAQNMPWGDPTGVVGPPSNGPGTGGGIGTGEGTGIGSGKGGGLGPGEGGGFGGGLFSVGGGVSAPIAIYSPDPPYSEEARKAKFSGTVVVQIVVDSVGNVREARVVKPLGLGLDEKAIETIRTWRFKPAMRNGTPVNVRMLVEVSFRLF